MAFALVAGGSDAGSGTLNIIKLLRLSRLVRALRLVVQFRMLWQLIRGLYSTLNLMFNTVVLVMLLLYIFACLGLEIITKDPEGLPPVPKFALSLSYEGFF